MKDRAESGSSVGWRMSPASEISLIKAEPLHVPVQAPFATSGLNSALFFSA